MNFDVVQNQTDLYVCMRRGWEKESDGGVGRQKSHEYVQTQVFRKEEAETEGSRERGWRRKGPNRVKLGLKVDLH